MNPALILAALCLVQMVLIVSALKVGKSKHNPFKIEPRGHWNKGTSAPNAAMSSRRA